MFFHNLKLRKLRHRLNNLHEYLGFSHLTNDELRFLNQITLTLKTCFFSLLFSYYIIPQIGLLGQIIWTLSQLLSRSCTQSSLWLMSNIRDSLHQIPYYFVSIPIKLGWYSRRKTFTNAKWGQLRYLHIQCPLIYLKFLFVVFV